MALWVKSCQPIKKHVESTILKIFIKLSCDEHDRIFGLVSHFPQYISHKKINTPILASYYSSERALVRGSLLRLFILSFHVFFVSKSHKETEGHPHFRLRQSSKNLWGEIFRCYFRNIPKFSLEWIQRFWKFFWRFNEENLKIFEKEFLEKLQQKCFRRVFKLVLFTDWLLKYAHLIGWEHPRISIDLKPHTVIQMVISCISRNQFHMTAKVNNEFNKFFH